MAHTERVLTLLSEQRSLFKRISSSVENCKKKGRSNFTTSLIQTRRDRVVSDIAQFRRNHATLLAIVPEEEHESSPFFGDDQLDTTEERALDAEEYYNELLNQVNPTPTTGPSPFASPIPSAIPPPHSSLPTQPLPRFNGQEEDWESFRDQFTSAVIDVPTLSNVQRLQYLKQAVSGSAQRIIRIYSMTNKNFELAWAALAHRYDNPTRLARMHFENLLDIKPVRHESLALLRERLDAVLYPFESLMNLGRTPAELWYDLAIHLVITSLPEPARREWHYLTSRSASPPTLTTLRDYIESRAASSSETSSSSSAPAEPDRRRVHTASVTTPTKLNCCCDGHHRFIECPSFRDLAPAKRRDVLKSVNRCFNCFSASHSLNNCPKPPSCRVCRKRHHSLLHDDAGAQSRAHEPPVSNQQSTLRSSTATSLLLATERQPAFPRRGMLATALIQISSSSGRSITARALIDPGAEVSFVTTRVVQMLRATCCRTSVSVTTVSSVTPVVIKRAASLSISSHSDKLVRFPIEALVMQSLTSYQPPADVDFSSFRHLQHLPLADPDLTSPEPISMILGAQVYSAVLRSGVRRGGPNEPIAQNTALGWMVLGGIPSGEPRVPPSQPATNHLRSVQVNLAHISSLDGLNRTMERFWDVEEVGSISPFSFEEEQCETHFVNTHSRHADGKYVVRLPFRSDPPPSLGDSYPIARRSMCSLLRRFEQRPELARDYRAFMHEYADLEHMILTRDLPTAGSSPTFIPHHPVVREGSSTSRLRVVFNASARSITGLSLNDSLHIGPKLQSDLSAVLLQWRQFTFVHSADIEKMYRQIWVDERDHHHQQILWLTPSSPRSFTSYTLRTVTYGMACAPYLALRVLKQLACDHGPAYPLGQEIVRSQTYVDDVLFGGYSLQEVRNKREQLTSLLAHAGFRLRKWAANAPQLLTDIDEHDHGLAMSKEFEPDEHLNVLGIRWSPSTDCFSVRHSLSSSAPNTKRAILSLIARFYDPLGWITPVIISAKVFLQSLWSYSLDWDDRLPPDLHAQWIAIFDHLPGVASVSLPRWTGQISADSRYDLHGFADASAVAYAAAVYIVTPDGDKRPRASLLVAKSRVAPRKGLTIPRLELSAALLLARLITFVTSTFASPPSSCWCWSDSTVTLAWIRGDPARWKSFVAHRVAAIQRILPDGRWRHIPTGDNPADCASRGLRGSELSSHSLWWTGPSWLLSPESHWPSDAPEAPAVCPEMRAQCFAITCDGDATNWDNRFSSWDRYVRIFAYIFRFLRRCRQNNQPSASRSYLAAHEITLARDFWIKRIQASCFPLELSALTKNNPLPSGSPLKSLAPFLDEQGTIRVGGRLQALTDPRPSKHPIVLGDHHVTRLIIRQTHLRAMHGGPQLTLSLLHVNYWIISGRRLTRAVVHACVTCAKARAAMAHQVMGSLPAARITPPSRAFVHTGVDYAGPILLRLSPRRGPSQKAYIALFVCLASRGIHLELVPNYSANAFRNAFDRFCSRRGLPESVASDNGTTFVGAARALQKAFRSAIADPEFQNRTATDRIQWHFIPPAAPHFGGIWEAGVKSVKHHLRRVVADRALSFEEYSTVLCRIEACLNSRPIAVLSESLDEPLPLTPGHLMVGGSLILPPEPSLRDVPENRLSRWQLLRAVSERFWRLWAHDYVNALQQRKKWRNPSTNLAVNQIVLVHNPLLPPCQWQLGRIIKAHPGPDGLVRVVTVRTASSELTRPITKLCPLPISSEGQEVNASLAPAQPSN